MKAQTAKRRRAQRGRPRDQDCERTPSGQKSRARQPQEDPRMVMLEARQRVHRVPEAVAASPHAATILGRMALVGWLSTAHLDAAKRYENYHAKVLRGIRAKVGLVVLGDGHSGFGDDDDEVRIDEERGVYDAMRRHLRREELAVLDLVLFDRLEPPPFALPYLFRALVKLADHLGFDPIKVGRNDNGPVVIWQTIERRVDAMLKIVDGPVSPLTLLKS